MCTIPDCVLLLRILQNRIFKNTFQDAFLISDTCNYSTNHNISKPKRTCYYYVSTDSYGLNSYDWSLSFCGLKNSCGYSRTCHVCPSCCALRPRTDCRRDRPCVCGRTLKSRSDHNLALSYLPRQPLVQDPTSPFRILRLLHLWK